MTLPEVWYGLVAFMLITYVVLDGFDLGVGALYFLIGRTAKERGALLRSIGPVWDANEVWLIAAGGSLVLAFPVLYARAFSGFYLPLMLMLWLFTFRALGIELRHQLHHPLWLSAWDFAFSASSVLLVVMFGAALGNIVRGVAFTANGEFFTPLWTNFDVDPNPGILDWYTLWVASHAVISLGLHGALWIAMRSAGPLRSRAGLWTLRLAKALAAQTLITTVMTFVVQPRALENVANYPAGVLAPLLAASGLGCTLWYTRREHLRAAFYGSCAYLSGMLASAAFAIFPCVLPARGAAPGLTLQQVAADSYSLRIGLCWWLPGMDLTVGYFVFNYRRLKADDSDESTQKP